MFCLIRNCQTVFWSSLYYFAVLSTVNESFYCSTNFPEFGVMSVLDFGLSNSCVVVSCCFNSLVTRDMGHHFEWLFSMCIISSLKCLCLLSRKKKFVFLSFKSSIFWITVLLNLYLHIFPPVVALFSHFVDLCTF